MDAITYELATQSLARTIRALTEESRGKLDDEGTGSWHVTSFRQA
jgi:hypothetical protein